MTSIALPRREFIGHLTKAAAVSALTAEALTLEACNYDWLTTAVNDLPTIVQVVTTIATIVADAAGGGVVTPAILAIINTAAQAATVALNLAIQLVKDYQANPSATVLEKIKTALLDVQSDIGQILDASHVFNIALRAVISTAIGVAITVLTQIMSLIPANTSAVKSTQVSQVKKSAIKPWNKNEIVTAFNNFASDNGYGKYAIH